MHEGAENGEGQGKQVDLVSEVEQLKRTNARLLEEAQKFKTRKSEVETLQEKLNSYERKKLEEEGNFQQMLEMEREEKARFKAMLEKKDNMILEGNIRSAVLKSAKDAWDVDDLLLQKDYLGKLQVDDETLKPTPESVQDFVNSLKSEKGHLFKNPKVSPMADSKPAIDKPREKTLKQMSNSERESFLKEQIAKTFQPRG